MSYKNQFKELVEKLIEIKFSDTPKKTTFLEIMKKQSSEVIASNVLEFFINPKNEHDMGDVFIEALKKISKIDDDLGEFQSVETEVVTENNKRIDIVINFEKYTIGIENKIYAELYNNLDEYKKTIVHENKGSKLLVLSLKHLTKKADLKKVENVDGDNIIYSQWFEEVKNLLGSKITEINIEYYIFLKQFIQNIENLIGEENMLKDEEYKTLFDNEKMIDDSYKAIKELRKDVLTRFKDKFESKLKDMDLSIGDLGWTYGNWEQNISIKEWDASGRPIFISLWLYNMIDYVPKVFVCINTKFLKDDKNKEKMSAIFKAPINKFRSSTVWSSVEGKKWNIELNSPIYNHEKFIDEAVNSAVSIVESINNNI